MKCMLKWGIPLKIAIGLAGGVLSVILWWIFFFYIRFDIVSIMGDPYNFFGPVGFFIILGNVFICEMHVRYSDRCSCVAPLLFNPFVVVFSITGITSFLFPDTTRPTLTLVWQYASVIYLTLSCVSCLLYTWVRRCEKGFNCVYHDQSTPDS